MLWNARIGSEYMIENYICGCAVCVCVANSSNAKRKAIKIYSVARRNVGRELRALSVVARKRDWQNVGHRTRKQANGRDLEKESNEKRNLRIVCMWVCAIDAVTNTMCPTLYTKLCVSAFVTVYLLRRNMFSENRIISVFAATATTSDTLHKSLENTFPYVIYTNTCGIYF